MILMEELVLLPIKEGIFVAGMVVKIEVSSASWNLVNGTKSSRSENRFQ
jgi:hypothetical protein